MDSLIKRAFFVPGYHVKPVTKQITVINISELILSPILKPVLNKATEEKTTKV